jgi:hypothetical protein
VLHSQRIGKSYKPIIAKGDIDDTVLDQYQELGKVIAAGCEAGIY